MRGYDPFREFRRIQDEMDKLFGQFFLGDKYLALPDQSTSGGDVSLLGQMKDVMREPLADMKDTGKEFVTSLEIPGVDKKDIKLNVTEDGLEINVEKSSEKREDKQGFVHVERGYRRFYRMMPFPGKVIPDKADATYKDGVLEVKVPKLHIDEKKKKLIEIK